MATSQNNVGSESVEDLDLKQCEIGSKTTVDKLRPTFGFDEKTSRSDLILTVDGKPLYVTRVVLEMVSPVFEKMLSETQKENEMEIKGKDYYDFAEFLACIYPGKMRKITIDNVNRILPLAFEFEIDCVQKTCEDVLVESLASSTEAGLFYCMDVAYLYEMDNLKKRSLDLDAKIFTKDIYRADELTELKNNWKVDIYDALTPTLRSDACKYKFWCVAKHVEGMKVEEFGNAKYVSVDSSFDIDAFFQTESKLFTYEIPALWFDLKLNITLKNFQTCKYDYTYGTYVYSNEYFECHASFYVNCTRVTSLAAVILEILNIVPGNQNLYIGKSLFISSKAKHFGTVRKNQICSEKGKYVLDGKIRSRIHLLVNQPYLVQ